MYMGSAIESSTCPLSLIGFTGFGAFPKFLRSNPSLASSSCKEAMFVGGTGLDLVLVLVMEQSRELEKVQ